MNLIIIDILIINANCSKCIYIQYISSLQIFWTFQREREREIHICLYSYLSNDLMVSDWCHVYMIIETVEGKDTFHVTEMSFN